MKEQMDMNSYGEPICAFYQLSGCEPFDVFLPLMFIMFMLFWLVIGLRIFK